MGSYSKSSKAPSIAKARKEKRHRRILHIPIPTQICHESSIFDDMNDLQRVLAFSYYYDHPHELPDRESGAAKRARQKPLKIRVKFDVGIFERDGCTRPIPLDELEGIDPLSSSSSSWPRSSVSNQDGPFCSPPPSLNRTNRWPKPLLY